MKKTKEKPKPEPKEKPSSKLKEFEQWLEKKKGRKK